MSLGAARTSACATMPVSDTSLVWGHFHIIEIHAELGVREDAGAALRVGDRIDAIDGPFGGFGLRGRPGFTANAGLAVSGVFHAQLQAIPGIRFPGERRG